MGSLSESGAAATELKKVLASALGGRYVHVEVCNNLLQCTWHCFPVKIECDLNFIMQFLALLD